MVAGLASPPHPLFSGSRASALRRPEHGLPKMTEAYEKCRPLYGSGDQWGQRGGALGASASLLSSWICTHMPHSLEESGLEWRQDICGALRMCPAPCQVPDRSS